MGILLEGYGYAPIRTPPAVSCKSTGLLDIDIEILLLS
jgi:hypothetical protein